MAAFKLVILAPLTHPIEEHQIPDVIVPTDCNDELVTPAANVPHKLEAVKHVSVAPLMAPNVAFHVPVAIVPSVVILVLPAQVLSAVFSTLLRLKSVLRLEAVLVV